MDSVILVWTIFEFKLFLVQVFWITSEFRFSLILVILFRVQTVSGSSILEFRFSLIQVSFRFYEEATISVFFLDTGRVRVYSGPGSFGFELEFFRVQAVLNSSFLEFDLRLFRSNWIQI